MKNKNIVDALKNALAGIWVLINEKAAQREIFLILISALMMVYFKNSTANLLLFLSLLILAFEALNTAIELICDQLTSDYNLTIKKIKDLSSASVLILLACWFYLLISMLVLIIK